MIEEKESFVVEVAGIHPKLAKQMKKKDALIREIGLRCHVHGININLEFDFFLEESKRFFVRFPANLPYLMHDEWNGVDGLADKVVRIVGVYLKKKNLCQTRDAQEYLRYMVKCHLLEIRKKIKEKG